MPNYSLGKIYKITCDEEPWICYIGSTCEPSLARRLAGHRGAYKQYLKSKDHKRSSFATVKYKSAKITLVEEFPCNNKDQLLQRERYWNNELNGISKSKAGIFLELGYEEYHKQHNKRYYVNNKERYQQYYRKNKKLSQSIKCTCETYYTYGNRMRHFRTKKHLSHPTILLRNAEKELEELNRFIESFESPQVL